MLPRGGGLVGPRQHCVELPGILGVHRIEAKTKVVAINPIRTQSVWVDFRRAFQVTLI